MSERDPKGYEDRPNSSRADQSRVKKSEGAGRARKVAKPQDPDPGQYVIREIRAGRVVGRNSETGQFVFAPAVKKGKTFIKMKRKVVRDTAQKRK